MNIPMVDLSAQYLTIKDEIDFAIQSILSSTTFIGGTPVKTFEQNFANYLGVAHCISCGNGTDSLEILLQAMGIGAGDEVIVPAISWISTSEAVSTVGAKPVFVDVDPLTYTIDVNLIETAITPKTKAIIPVHLYGHPADLISIKIVAQKHGLNILEDCAQAHHATINNKMIGTIGDAASFSFFPGKNLGAYGDAGAMVTNNEEIAHNARLIANHGQIERHNHITEGRNSRLDSLQAAILNVKLKYIDNWTSARIRVAEKYTELLSPIKDLTLPTVSKNMKHVFHLYVIQTSYQSELYDFLVKRGVSASIHYPKALPFLKCYKQRGYHHDDFPAAANMQSRILSLPMYPELSDEQILYIENAITEFYNSKN